MSPQPASIGETAEPALRMESLRFAYPGGPNIVDISHCEVARGDTVFLRGPSGSGKSTLLGLVGGILSPTAGKLQVLGHNLGELRPTIRDRFRADHVGFIFQMFNLLPYLSVLDNVTLPGRFSIKRANAPDGQSLTQYAQHLLQQLGLSHNLWQRPVTALSVGQQQRVAAARALIGRPGLLVADEPTSALDAENREQFIQVLLSEAATAGSTVLFVSHDPALAPYFQRSVDLGDINQAPQQ
ncbi:MAG: ABC transporter ATP-binding protein [Lysobacterales bacterium]